MAGRRRCVTQNRESRNGKARRGGYAVGLGGAAGAFLALGMTALTTAPRVHADFEDLLQPITDAIAQSVSLLDPALASSLDPSLDIGSLAAPALAADIPGLDVGGVAASPMAAAAAENATIPLQLTNNGTDPVVDISVGGGPNIPVVADTGSVGLMVPWYDVGFQNLSNLLGSHITLETTSYGGSPGDANIDILYIQDPETTVSFGNGIVTSPTTVDLELFAYPASNSNLFDLSDYSLPGYLGNAQADGLLGIGAEDTVGPGPSSVITALPGDLNQGVLINETGRYLEFGPNPLTPYASVLGAPITPYLEVAVGGGGAVSVPMTVDSGGVYGTIPSSILNNAPALGQPLSPGTEISVYTSNDQWLYSYTTTATDSPTVNSDTTMNTGFEAFNLFPIYLSYSPIGDGTTVFDYDH
jgi:hypothetical protein